MINVVHHTGRQSSAFHYLLRRRWIFSWTVSHTRERRSCFFTTPNFYSRACRHEKVANAMSLSRPHLSSIAQKWQGALANVSSRLKFPDCLSRKMVFIINHTCFQFLVSMATAQKHRNRRKEWEVRPTPWSVC